MFFPLFALGVYSRSGQPEGGLDPLPRLATSVLAPTISLLFYAICVSVVRHRSQPTPLWLPPTLWLMAGSVTGVMAGLIRADLSGRPGLDVTNIILSAIFAAVTVGIATVGVSSLTERRRQTGILAQQRDQLLDLRSQARAFAIEQTQILLSVIAHVVSPEIDRLRSRVRSLGVDPSIDKLRDLQQIIAEDSTEMVRRISHEASAQPTTVAVTPAPVKSTGRDILHLVSAATISIPLTVITAVMLFAAQFNLGCLGVPTLAVLAFLVVTLGVGSLGLAGPLSKPPVSLLWLVFATGMGFAAYRVVLALSPSRCSWTTSGWESAVASLTALTGFLVLTVVVQASRQAAQMVRDLESTNEQIAVVTRQFNLAGLITQEQISRVLHGPIQGRLAAAAMAIRVHLDQREAGRHPSTEALTHRVTTLLDEAAEDLHTLTDSGVPTPLDIKGSLLELGQRWSGFLHATINVMPEADTFLAHHPEWTARVIQCAEEALTNSSRHGSARHATVTLSIDGSIFLSLEVLDDGQGPDEDVVIGLGLGSVTTSGGTWSLSRRDCGGAALTVRWPLPQTL